MTFSQVLLILRARRWILVGVMLAMVAAAITISFVMPKKYTASTTLVLNYKGVDPLTGVVIPAQLMPGYMATQAGVITSRGVALNVVDALGLEKSERAERTFLPTTGDAGTLRERVAKELLKNVSVDAARDSSILTIHARATDPHMAVALADSFAEQYQQASAELRKGPMKGLAVHLAKEVDQLKATLQDGVAKRTRFQSETGIVNVDERLDSETTRLGELSRALVAVQSQQAEARAQSAQARGVHAEQAPDVANNPLIQRLQESVSRAETNLARLEERYTEQHPAVVAAKAELQKEKSVLRRQIRSASATAGTAARAADQRVAELQKAVDAQRKKILELNGARAQLAMLDKQVDSDQRALDNAANRLQQVLVEASAGQADIAILAQAGLPLKPSSPRPMLNVLLSIALGFLMGVALTVLVEVCDRRVRSVRDLTQLHLDVLGEVSQRAVPAWRMEHVIP